jgi:hypothetical protein
MANPCIFVPLILLAPCCCVAQTPAVNSANKPADQSQNTQVTESKRLREYVKSWLSPVSLLMCAAGAGWGQLRDAPHEWGEGDEAFDLRLASAYGQHFVNSTLLLTGTSLFHEDNRYVPSGDFRTGARLKYALASSVISRHDDPGGGSHRRVSFSRIAAFAGAALISRAWQPPSPRGPGHAAISFGGSIAVTAGFNVVREFLNFK